MTTQIETGKNLRVLVMVMAVKWGLRILIIMIQKLGYHRRNLWLRDRIGRKELGFLYQVLPNSRNKIWKVQ